MKYIVDSKEVSRDAFYFCKRAKEENKTFVLLKTNTYVDDYINEHPNYDYYICDDLATYYTKGEAIVKEWYERSWSNCTCENMKKRYDKSKFKNILSFTEWYTNNGWKYKTKLNITKESHDIPAVEDFEEAVTAKLFSVTVANDDTVKTINELRDKYGEYCIEYVLRDYTFTEIIYKDTYKEI